MMPGPPWLPWSAWGIPPPAVAPNGLGGADLSRCDPRAGSVTAVTEQTRTGTPTKTVVINYHDPYRNELARWDYYQEVSPGQILEELPSPFPPGTRANVIKAYVSEDDSTVFVIEIANIKTPTPGA